ncbi:RND efflux system, outer membrane lipoprotein, NodT family [Gluconacetobacter diazotrophicus PA1 5]|uniref:Outer membrane efflux protein n=2 Tax=Gluconacetobacter diazotrophicus TaxID=33996 RepID=A9H3U0_GLUDA|nr:efflux transporter outer membrane subunit [Gluconacetobacter diazotrophicus]ACI52685.1 RND efflux system, outer membrane lipoprotein, NodT family [Gluconacetobacter diazotrophicus PA1 5]MBB2156438.1 efflux transporter outer membrane subunit [Gluconacetobacter diazotrophicus]TWB06092.1 NodT family efflux transporter outer membrane factor (OMF) lipoprotein [Gluconacetobacter diazotrophicus]CAP57359.1 Outer membrane efflux protein [Gluconacetobacter diazotrophicus PA1 5]
MNRVSVSSCALRSTWRRFANWTALAGVVFLGGCDLAPTYHPVKLAYPDNWEGSGVFRFGRPDEAAPRKDWWTVFNDPQLNALEDQVARLNPDLQAEAEAFMQARDIAMQARSQLFPQISGGAGGEKEKSSAHRLWRAEGSTTPLYMSSEQYYGSATWEPDFWSSIRNKTRMAKEATQQLAADYALARLSIQSEVASDYIALRGFDAQDAVYRDSIAYYQQAVSITQLRLAGAISPGMDVARAQTQFYATQARETDVRAARDVLEHAIAVLVNKAPASFHIAPVDSYPFAPVQLPVVLPSELLQRRPDIASAERSMAQANRAIGVSRAAFYPHVTFNAMTGFMDHGFDLASLSNSMYQFGAQAVLPIFTAGLRRAELQRTWSQYRQSEDKYRSTVLGAFREVEDNLTLTSRLRTETTQASEAVNAALRTQRMSMALYTGGLTNYLDVVVAQQAALEARIILVQVQARQSDAEVQLVRAYGGGWSTGELPASDSSIMPFSPLQYNELDRSKPLAGISVDPVAGATDLGSNPVPPKH